MTEPNEETTVVETVAVQTEAVTTPAAEPARIDLGKVRELVLKAHPDVVPDLIAGSSVDELIASVEPARGAYQRIAEQVRGTESGVGSRESEVRTDFPPPTSDQPVIQPPPVPAGGGANVEDPGQFGPATRIAQALAARRRQ